MAEQGDIERDIALREGLERAAAVLRESGALERVDPARSAELDAFLEESVERLSDMDHAEEPLVRGNGWRRPCHTIFACGGAQQFTIDVLPVRKVG